MVNMPPTNAKLKRRAEAMVAQIAQCAPSQATSSLEQAEGDIKTAVLLALGIDKNEAATILTRYDGNLRRVFAQLSRDRDKDRDRHLKAETERTRGKAIEP